MCAQLVPLHLGGLSRTSLHRHNKLVDMHMFALPCDTDLCMLAKHSERRPTVCIGWFMPLFVRLLSNDVQEDQTRTEKKCVLIL